MVLGDFQNSPPFERSACFYLTNSENFEHFQYFKFENDFLENENVFQKTGVLVSSWTRIKIEKAPFPYKNAISEANVKTNKDKLNGNYKRVLSQRTEFCQ